MAWKMGLIRSADYFIVQFGGSFDYANDLPREEEPSQTQLLRSLFTIYVAIREKKGGERDAGVLFII